MHRFDEPVQIILSDFSKDHFAVGFHYTKVLLKNAPTSQASNKMSFAAVSSSNQHEICGKKKISVRLVLSNVSISFFFIHYVVANDSITNGLILKSTPLTYMGEGFC